jgi:hypothetical protein
LLTLEALPENLRATARVVLMSQSKPDASAKTSAKLLAELSTAKIFSLPWLGEKSSAAKKVRVRRTLRELAGNLI